MPESGKKRGRRYEGGAADSTGLWLLSQRNPGGFFCFKWQPFFDYWSYRRRKDHVAGRHLFRPLLPRHWRKADVERYEKHSGSAGGAHSGGLFLFPGTGALPVSKKLKNPQGAGEREAGAEGRTRVLAVEGWGLDPVAFRGGIQSARKSAGTIGTDL